MPKLILITGGARSGKSQYAIKLALNTFSPVTFIATASISDAEMKKRVELHRQSRPSHWKTIEEHKDVASVLSRINSPQQVVIIDCLTLLISNLLLQGSKEKEILDQVKEIANQGRKCNRITIVVSNEVGWGIVPSNPLSRIFRDISGTANQLIAAQANQVWLMVCGIPYKLKDEQI